jgi:hypothetical protein
MNHESVIRKVSLLPHAEPGRLLLFSAFAAIGQLAQELLFTLLTAQLIHSVVLDRLFVFENCVDKTCAFLGVWV